MYKWIKIVLISSLLFTILFLGISTYKKSGKSQNQFVCVKKIGNMLIGGTKPNQEKIDSFTEGLIKDDDFNKYWDLLDKSNELRKKPDYKGAIVYRVKALDYAQGIGQQFQARMGLAKLYEMDRQYDLALKEYEWLLDHSKRSDVIEKLKESHDRVHRALIAVN